MIDEKWNSSVDLDGFAGQGYERVLKDFKGTDRLNLKRRKAALYGTRSSFRTSSVTGERFAWLRPHVYSFERRCVHMLLHGFILASHANGPGLRAVIYFQGCSLNCVRCWNPVSHKFSGEDVTVSSVTQRIEVAMQSTALEGVTFSGGE